MRRCSKIEVSNGFLVLGLEFLELHPPPLSQFISSPDSLVLQNNLISALNKHLRGNPSHLERDNRLQPVSSPAFSNDLVLQVDLVVLPPLLVDVSLDHQVDLLIPVSGAILFVAKLNLLDLNLLPLLFEPDLLQAVIDSLLHFLLEVRLYHHLSVLLLLSRRSRSGSSRTHHRLLLVMGEAPRLLTVGCHGPLKMLLRVVMDAALDANIL
mmetsp:Transcript_17286/g.26664  ORF Transcript_17286/g.26664 Transcript_17286/m.26664 type:complete len:210 (-) Transcript_17286:3619-4248(-)